jgi:F-type H+-transporting ATPase subunit b
MEQIIEILGSIGFDWRVALANLVNFLIVFYLLNKFVLSAVRKTLAERKARIEQGIEDARNAEAALIDAQAREEEIVAQATLSANEIVSEAHTTKDGIVARAKHEAADAASAVLRKADEEIERKRLELERDIEKQTADLVVDGVRKMFADNLDDAGNEALITRMTSRKS